MHRKDELKILIENQKKEQKAFWDNVEKNRKHITKRVIDAVVQFAKQHGEDVEGKIDSICWKHFSEPDHIRAYQTTTGFTSGWLLQFKILDFHEFTAVEAFVPPNVAM